MEDKDEDDDWRDIATAPLNTRIEMKLDKAVGPGENGNEIVAFCFAGRRGPI